MLKLYSFLFIFFRSNGTSLSQGANVLLWKVIRLIQDDILMALLFNIRGLVMLDSAWHEPKTRAAVKNARFIILTYLTVCATETNFTHAFIAVHQINTSGTIATRIAHAFVDLCMEIYVSEIENSLPFYKEWKEQAYMH